MKKILLTLAAALVVALGHFAPADAGPPPPGPIPDRWVQCVRAPCP